MRKQLKKASEHITTAKEILDHVSRVDNIPQDIRLRAEKISTALDVDINELQRMRSYVPSA